MKCKSSVLPLRFHTVAATWCIVLWKTEQNSAYVMKTCLVESRVAYWSTIFETWSGTEHIKQMKQWIPHPCLLMYDPNTALISIPHTQQPHYSNCLTLPDRRSKVQSVASCAVHSLQSTFAQSCKIRVSGIDANNVQNHSTWLMWKLWILTSQFSVQKQLSFGLCSWGKL